MVCPKCHEEYREGFVRCADCGVPLVEGAAQRPVEEDEATRHGWERIDEDIDLSAFVQLSGAVNSDFSGESLDEAGIEWIVRPNCARVPRYTSRGTFMGFAMGHGLFVPKEREDEAMKIMGWEKKTEPVEEEGPEGGIETAEEETKAEGTDDTEDLADTSEEQMSLLDIKDWKGKPIRNNFYLRGSDSVAVFYPGLSYAPAAPLFFYLRCLFEREGWDLLEFDYRYNENDAFMLSDEISKTKWLEYDAEAIGKKLAADLEPYENVVFVAKSLGTTLLHRQVAKSLLPPQSRFIWLTPGTSAPAIYKSLTTLDADSLVAVGTADEYYDRQAVESAADNPRTEIVELEDAGHVFEIDEDLSQSIDNLAAVVEAMADFLGLSMVGEEE